MGSLGNCPFWIGIQRFSKGFYKSLENMFGMTWLKSMCRNFTNTLIQKAWQGFYAMGFSSGFLSLLCSVLALFLSLTCLQFCSALPPPLPPPLQDRPPRRGSPLPQRGESCGWPWCCQWSLIPCHLHLVHEAGEWANGGAWGREGALDLWRSTAEREREDS